MKRKYVLKNKKRFIIFILSIFCLMTSMIYSDIAYGSKVNQYLTVTVQSGDTLWSIAERFCNHGDIREYIYELKQLNSLSNSEIFEGDQIKVPAKD
ncbi:MAG: LysM peptidoglycan-binding domain-containing protein [Clostridia bacterium]|nr:LysM peptidoglycan-binding domain-containing protein [Clostridia bacterium]